MVQRKLLSLSVLVIRAGGIDSTLLLLLAASGVGRIVVVDHNDVEVSNLHWKVIYSEVRRGMSNARSTYDAIRSLNPIVLVTAVAEPLTWDNTVVTPH